MTEIINDQAIDRAEAFRLAKSYRLGPEIALNRDPSVLRFDLFTACYGISDSGIIRRIRHAKLSAGMMSAISSDPSIGYADRLSHFTDRGTNRRGAMGVPRAPGAPRRLPGVHIVGVGDGPRPRSAPALTRSAGPGQILSETLSGPEGRK